MLVGSSINPSIKICKRFNWWTPLGMWITPLVFLGVGYIIQIYKAENSSIEESLDLIFSPSKYDKGMYAEHEYRFYEVR